MVFDKCRSAAVMSPVVSPHAVGVFLSNGGCGRGRYRSSGDRRRSAIAVDLSLRTVPRDVADLSASIAGLAASGIQGAAVGRGAIAADMALRRF